MDEQQMNEGLLCDADRELIASAARLQKYVEAPVPAGLLGELSDDLLKLAFIPMRRGRNSQACMGRVSTS